MRLMKIINLGSGIHRKEGRPLRDPTYARMTTEIFQELVGAVNAEEVN